MFFYVFLHLFLVFVYCPWFFIDFSLQQKSPTHFSEPPKNLPKTLVKNLLKNLAKNLVKNLAGMLGRS